MAPADGIVLERSFADALGLRVGAAVRLAAAGGPIELPIVGTAISPSQPRYPRSNPGLAWVPRRTLARIVPDRSRWSWNQAIRLPDPAAAPAFAARAAASLPPEAAFIQTWQDQRAEALREAQPLTIILTTYTIVLLIVVFAVVAILVGARATAQHREIGLLKAVGLTPRQVTAVFALETAALGLIALVIGFALGALLAPRLAAPTAETTLGSPTTAASPWHLLLAGIPVLLVLVGSARSSTRRSTRFTVLHAINPAPHRPPRDRPWRTPSRAPRCRFRSHSASRTSWPAAAARSVRERIRDYGVLKTIGLTPGQIASSLVGAHAAVALIAALLSIPIGIALFRAVYAIAGAEGDDLVIASWWSLTLVPIGTLLMVAAATSLPARLATRIPTADALRYE